MPTTLLVIMPTNRQLLAPGRSSDAPEARALLVRWGRPHAIRTATSALASLVFLAQVFWR